VSARVAIGDFSRMTHLSVIALRHYHEVGLLTPAEVDPRSGYRFYTPGQVQVAQVIRRFRDLGMPLDQIRQVLQASDVAVRNQVIAAHLQRMEAQLALTQSVVASLRSLLDRTPPPVAVEHRSVPAALALAICGQVPASDLDAWWEAAFGELDAAVAASAVRPAGPRAALYPAEFFELGAGQVTAYIPVAGRVRDAGRARMLQVPAAELAVAVHQGTLADVDQTYGALGLYVTGRGIGAAGPIREQYVVTQFDTDDESGLRTEVCWPVHASGQPRPAAGGTRTPDARPRAAGT
jgi:DNA-binding transcriptional MerR regulator/effector-binding domain-containing protein